MSAARLIAFVLACVTLAAPARAELPDTSASPTIAVRGQLLALEGRYVIFATGDALRVRAGTAVPKGATLGSAVVVTIDRLGRDVVAIALEPPPALGEIGSEEIPREFVVAAPKSVRTIAPPVAMGTSSLGDAANARTTVTLEVTVPSNTPTNDDVYVSTDRSNYSPSEIRMQRIGSRRFTATVALAANGRLKYQYTRGNYATVERDRSGGIVEPHVVERGVEKTSDVVTRWADVN